MQKRLMRSRTDKQVAGVAAGLASYFNIDPTLVRLIFVVATIMGGPGLLVYIVLWVVMPEEGPEGIVMGEKRKHDDPL
ncbi:MAG: PspC domain-containing protein [Chloroflexota bacterium]|nr:PspC domain-containing protein [Chloroflexota bacterium]